jgi:hypothetical protein
VTRPLLTAGYTVPKAIFGVEKPFFPIEAHHQPYASSKHVLTFYITGKGKGITGKGSGQGING